MMTLEKLALKCISDLLLRFALLCAVCLFGLFGFKHCIGM